MFASIPADMKSLWWLPSHPQNKVSGVLHLSHETWPVLELEGRLGNLRTTKDRLPTMLGLTQGGQAITLLECSLHGFGERVGWKDGEYVWLKHDSYSAEVALVGGHVASESGQLFDALTFRFSRLDEWVYGRRSGGTGLFELIDPERDSATGRYKVEFQPEKGWQCRIPQGTLSFSCSLQASRHEQTGIALKPDVSVRVALDPPLQFIPSWEQVGLELESLFSLVTGVPIRRESVSGHVLSQDQPGPAEVEAFFPAHAPTESLSPVKWYDMLTEYRDVALTLGLSAETWMSRSVDMRGATRAFLAAKDGTYYMEQKFLELARALEAYGRIKHTSKRLMEAVAFKELVGKLMVVVESCVPSEQCGDIQIGLGNLNQVSFYTKLCRLLGEPYPGMPQLASKSSALSREIAEWRHALTHSNENSEIRGDRVDRIRDLSHLMELVLEACFLTELHVPESVVRGSIKRQLGLHPGVRALLGIGESQ
jgi:hypothetical protein